MKKVIGIIASFLILGCLSAAAQDGGTRAEVRQDAQRVRIAQGIREGEVTRREAAGLRMEQRHVRRARRRAAADGQVTPMERRKLDRKQRRASRDIHRARHNDRDRVVD